MGDGEMGGWGDRPIRRAEEQRSGGQVARAVFIDCSPVGTSALCHRTSSPDRSIPPSPRKKSAASSV
jgi:hypothetical protein